MKSLATILLFAALAGSALAADAPSATPPAATASDRERIDYLVRQEQLHAEEIARLKAEVARPRSRAELFATCMQAARSQTSAMGAEAVGEHCDRLWKDQ